jgi:hypothetical protein
MLGHSEERTVGIAKLGQDSQDRTARKGQVKKRSGEYRQAKKERTGRPEHYSMDRATGIGQPGRDNQTFAKMSTKIEVFVSIFVKMKMKTKIFTFRGNQKSDSTLLVNRPVRTICTHCWILGQRRTYRYL